MQCVPELGPNSVAGSNYYSNDFKAILKKNLSITSRTPRLVTPWELDQAVRQLLDTSQRPVLEEPGEELYPLCPGRFSVDVNSSHLLITVWDDRRNLSRRAVAIEEQRPGRLKLTIEKFGGKKGYITLYDAARPTNLALSLHGRRLVFREHFRLMLRREMTGWKLETLTSEIDLQHTLSPKFPRALLRMGTTAWAAIASPPDCHTPDEILTYGLIWLDYLRRREPKLTVQGLILFLPADQAKVTALRLQWLDPQKAQYKLFIYNLEFGAQLADLADWGNLSSRLDVCRRPLEETQTAITSLVESILAEPEVEGIQTGSGTLSLRVRGLEFAVFAGGQLDFGLNSKLKADDHHLGEIKQTVETLRSFRSPQAIDKQSPLYIQRPELWLESQVRQHIPQIEPWLHSAPIYGQVPAFTANDRAIIDLLATSRDGRLTVIELKASEDPHLPLQALDYWIRVNWHALRGEFSPLGYFPGIGLRRESPRLMLIAPALEFHPTTETILRFFSSQVQVERLGVALEWRHRVQILFRLSGADHATSLAEST